MASTQNRIPFSLQKAPIRLRSVRNPLLHSTELTERLLGTVDERLKDSTYEVFLNEKGQLR